MLLSARFLNAVANVNSFEYANVAEWVAGNALTLYFQLIDDSLDRADQGFKPAGRRYMPPDDSTLTVLFGSVDDAKKVTRTATQPFSNDPSIWAVSILATDPIAGTVPVTLTLTEGAEVKKGFIQAGVRVRPLT